MARKRNNSNKRSQQEQRLTVRAPSFNARHSNYIADLLDPFTGSNNSPSPLFQPSLNGGQRVSFEYKRLLPIITNGTGRCIFAFRPSPSGMNTMTADAVEHNAGQGDFLVDFHGDILALGDTDHLDNKTTICGGIKFIPTSPADTAGSVVIATEIPQQNGTGTHDNYEFKAGDLNRSQPQTMFSGRKPFTILNRPGNPRGNTLNGSYVAHTDAHEIGPGWNHSGIVLQFDGPASTVLGYVVVVCRVDAEFRPFDNVGGGGFLTYNRMPEAQAMLTREVLQLHDYAIRNAKLLHIGDEGHHEALKKHTRTLAQKLVTLAKKQAIAGGVGLATFLTTESPEAGQIAYTGTLAIENME